MQKKRWAELSAVQKVGIVIGATMQFGLLVAGLWDLYHRTADEVRGDRRFWAGFMFVNWIGPIAYFTIGRKECPLRSWSCRTEEAEVTGEPAAADPLVTDPLASEEIEAV